MSDDIDTGDDSLCNVRRLRRMLRESDANIERIKELLSARYNQASIKDGDQKLAEALRSIIHQIG